MLDTFAENSILINEIESIADMDLRDIKCIFLSEDDYYMTTDEQGLYIWDTVGKPSSKDLRVVLTDLECGYTAIPF